MDVIIEKSTSLEEMMGHSSNYLEIYVPKDEIYLRKNVCVSIESYQDGKLRGRILEERS